MGYADTLPYQQFSLQTNQLASLTCTTVDTETTIGTLTIPNFKRPVSLAYLDVVVPFAENTAVADNWLDHSYWYYDDTVGSKTVCGSDSTALFTKGSEYWHGYYMFVGTGDIHAYINAGATATISFRNDANANNIVLKNMFAQLRLYFNI